MKKIHLVAYKQDILEVVCQNILKRHYSLLPDFSSLTIFLPNNLAQNALREKLMQYATDYNNHALLLPKLTTLRKWIFEKSPPNKPLLSQYARELILVNAINNQKIIFQNSNPWAIANELLSLFESMLLNNVQVDNINNYIKSENNISYALSQEAKLVKILFQAWLDDFSNEKYTDPVLAYTQSLELISTSKEEIFYAIGFERASINEVLFFKKLATQSNLFIYSYASGKSLSTKPDTAVQNLVAKETTIQSHQTKNSGIENNIYDIVYENNNSYLAKRAYEFSKNINSSPIKNKLKIFKSNSFSQHTQAIDIKVRSYLHQGKENIGIVISDRKLARRLRAVLEHSNINVNDLGGWALSTTSAINIIETWFQLIEENFSAKILLNLLKSPFFPILCKVDLHQEAIDYLEKEIILHYKLHSGLNNIRKNIEAHENKQHEKNKELFNYLYTLLEQIEASTLSLKKLYNATTPLQYFIETLLNSLKISGIYSELNKDEAGEQALKLIISQISNLKFLDGHMNWFECRRFLARILDQQNFKPTIIKSNVTLCSIEQSKLLKFDALIIASVDEKHFPNNPNQYIFFNESIRSELDIPTWRNEHALQLHQFRCLLDASPDILITVQNEQDGQTVATSPWLQILETFHIFAYGDNLLDHYLINLMQLNDTIIEYPQNTAIAKKTSRPSPTINETHKPQSISISQYQQLVNCPYQFFAKTCLNLSKTDDLSEELTKSDFGSLVHKCIHAFFVDTPSLPGPFKQNVNSDTRKDAENLLHTISQKIFAVNTPKNFSNSLWLQRWRNLIPAFIEWEIKKQQDLIPYKHEESLFIKIQNDLILRGRIDRIDKNEMGFTISDYKTGQTPTRNSILTGEEVQLSTYALLQSECNQVEFISIGKNNTVKSEAIINENSLEILKLEHKKRLAEISNSVENTTKFPALADDEVCDWCDVKGLCRKSFWDV